MEDLEQEITDKIKEVSFQLWQSLITVNTLLATILIALIAFKELSVILKMFAILGLILTTSSCILLIINFMNIKAVYRIISEQIQKGDIPNEKESKSHLDFSVKKFNENESNEKRAILSSIFAWILLAIIVLFGLMPPIMLP